jgi:hypothetical protein
VLLLTVCRLLCCCWLAGSAWAALEYCFYVEEKSQMEKETERDG